MDIKNINIMFALLLIEKNGVCYQARDVLYKKYTIDLSKLFVCGSDCPNHTMGPCNYTNAIISAREYIEKCDPINVFEIKLMK